tara:strand:+ start:142 stop:666 length:525 start_codon:yes stop_codon:yes gene_type:complete
MKIYNYNRDTGEYVGESTATPNPVTIGEWLIPAYATTDAPPSSSKGEVVVWDSESKGWTTTVDKRGTTVYDTTTGEDSVVDYIGPIRDTHTTKERPSEFHKWNKTDWEEDLDEKWEYTRTTRNGLLADSDWTVLTDSPLSTSKKTKWKTYRQELRDIPSTFSKTDTVTWPTKPE